MRQDLLSNLSAEVLRTETKILSKQKQKYIRVLKSPDIFCNAVLLPNHVSH